MKTRLPRLLLPAFALSLILPALSPAGGVANGATCPSPAPTCSTSGTFSGGNFNCTDVATNSSGGVRVGLLVLSISAAASGSGTFSGELTQNRNDSTITTTFSQQAVSGTYCINSDDVTGVVTPSMGCALVFALDSGATEMRLIDSGEQKAEATVCRKQ